MAAALLVKPASPSVYWREWLPYAALDEAFADPATGTWASVQVGRRFVPSRQYADEGYWVRHNPDFFDRFDGGLNAWRGHLDARVPDLRELHLVPDPHRFLAFDLDLRDQPVFAQQGCLARHGGRLVCARCWTLVERMAAVLDRALHQSFAAPKPLLVYSGGGGVHAWYHFRPATHGYLLADPAARAALFWDVVQPAMRAAGLKLDEKPTLQPNHMIRMPFSLHKSTGRIALPFADAHVLPAAAWTEVTEPVSVVAAIHEGVHLLRTWTQAAH